ncbi:MAG: hypothetical protein ACJ8AW_15875 [Rhodopila sp.]
MRPFEPRASEDAGGMPGRGDILPDAKAGWTFWIVPGLAKPMGGELDYLLQGDSLPGFGLPDHPGFL